MESDSGQKPTNFEENNKARGRVRVPLENLTKDELIAKCKCLLALAQKAKQAKDEYSGKNKVLLAQLSENEIQKQTDKSTLFTMKEMLDNLTDNKLSLTLKIVDLENQIEKLNSKITQFSIENEGLNRQLKRMTDENEDLINDLEKMESKFIQTSKEYTEQQRTDDQLSKDVLKNFQEFEIKFKAIDVDNLKLKKILEQTNLSIEKSKKCEAAENNNIEALNNEHLNEIKRMKKEEIKLLDEIQHLKSKINDVALKFKKLKGSRKILIENERDYSESVSKWQQDIKLVSQKLLSYIRALEKDKRNLQNRIKLLENIFRIKDRSYFEEIESKVEVLLDICKKAMDEDCEMIKKIKELESYIEIQQNLNEDMNKENNILKLQLTQIKTNKEGSVRNENDNQDNINVELIKTNEDNNLRQNSIQEYIEKYDILGKEKDSLVLILKSTQDSCENFEKHKLQKEIEHRKETEKLLKAEVCDLIENSEQKSSTLKSMILQNAQMIERVKEENLELLSEMRELNEALKARGDIISRQQNTIISLEAELKKIPNDHTSDIEVKEKSILNFSNRAESPIHYLTDNQSEVFSLSSITKAEEPTSMQDVQEKESLEEKYNKLKILAVKMKRKIQEQKMFITKLEKREIEMQISDSQDPLPDQKTNTQNLQTENKYLRQIEDLNIRIIEHENETKTLQQRIALQNEDLREKEKALEGEIKQRNSKEQVISEKSNEIKLLKQEKDAFNLIRKEWEKEKEVFKKTLCDKERQINKLNESLEKLKKDLEKSKAIGKQSNVLNLEIEAYEKSLNENAERLNSLKILNQKLSESVQFKDATISSLKLEIKLLEENVNSENTHSAELKQEINSIQTKLKQIEHEKLESQSKLQDCAVENEVKHSELEELRLQLSDITVRKNAEISDLIKENDKILTQFAINEENLNQTNLKLKITEQVLENIRTEYASYKIRAQSVLRQNQNKETNRERELEEELTTMQANFEPLKLEIAKQTEIIYNQEKKMDELLQENERIQKRSKEIIDLLQESREQCDSLLEENRKHSKDYQESLKAHRLQIETLTNCYKEQIIDLEQKHLTAIEELKKNNVSSLISRVGPFGAPGITDQTQKSSDEQKVEILLMEREDAEGSEASYTLPNRKNSTLRSKHDVIPLEVLLNSSLDENSEEIYSDRDSKTSAESEIQILKEKIQSKELKVKHLTSLLSETEQDLIKYTQLNEVLKEELRRQERTLEREKHMHNSEYLKNVILKFLTLNSGDERSCLVPVLNTILRLSPDEAHVLQNVAKGIDAGRTWNLLPIWSNNNQ